MTSRNTCLLFTVCLFLTTLPCIGQESERAQLGYVGPVRSARAGTVKFVNGKRTGSKKLSSLDYFDRQGNLIDDVDYNDEGGRNWHNKSIFQNGKKIGWKAKSSPEDEWDEFLYKYDAAGKVVEQSSYNDDGTISLRTLYFYDTSGRQIEQIDESHYFK